MSAPAERPIHWVCGIRHRSIERERRCLDHYADQREIEERADMEREKVRTPT